MQIIHKFHLMEIEERLFEIGKDINMPCWDIVRYAVYIKYYYPEDQRLRLIIAKKHSFFEYIFLIYQAILFGWRMLTADGSNIVITASRSLSASGQHFDKCAMPIIDELGKNCLILESILGKKIAYRYAYNFNCIFRRFNRKKPLPIEYFNIINDALIKHFNKNLISYDELNNVFHAFQSDLKYYKIIFKIKRTKVIFIAEGNPKAILLAAKKENIRTYLIQHAGIEFDEIDYSYPVNISNKNNISFPEFVLTLGEYWCKNVNVPARKIIPIGNDLFFNKPRTCSDNSILIISTIIHGDELKMLTKQLSRTYVDTKIIYKLHPNEYHFLQDYIEFFKIYKNVTVLTNEFDIGLLIAKAQLVILIVSAVLYEALNQNKKVAVYKKINFARQLHLADLPNLYFFNDADEIKKILQMPIIPTSLQFYKPTDYIQIKKICHPEFD